MEIEKQEIFTFSEEMELRINSFLDKSNIHISDPISKKENYINKLKVNVILKNSQKFNESQN